MSITYFHVPEAAAADMGLHELTFRDIGNTVVLIGKNGAGKTRILNALIQSSRSQAGSPSYQNGVAVPYVNPNLKTRDSVIVSVVRAFPSAVALEDPRQRTRQTIATSLANTERLFDIAAVPQYGIAWIEQVMALGFEADHQDTEMDEEDIQRARASRARLQEICNALLNTTLGYKRQQATIFGRYPSDAQLSSGQTVLLQIAIALHRQSDRLQNAVLVLDEPENHLHPSAVITALDRLASLGVQTWIATHSIPLIAHLAAKDSKSLWYVSDGVLQRTGRNPLAILEGLVGQQHIGPLQDFIGLPLQLAALQFSAQCLCEPTTSAFHEKDPQVAQIGGALSSPEFNDGPIRVVDFGAGQGRLLEGLVTDYPNMKLDYFAYDILDADKNAAAACNATIAARFDDGKVRRFEGLSALRSGLNPGSVDVIVLCNVLHEIPPEEWLKIFGEEGVLTTLLRDTGQALIVEDQRIPMGERAHRYGFLIFDEPDLKQLFAVREQDVEDRLFVRRADPHGRLTAHRINKQLLARHSAAHTTAAIRSLRDRSLEALTRMHVQTDQSSGSSHLYGFWCQQFTNAYLFLKDHGLN